MVVASVDSLTILLEEADEVEVEEVANVDVVISASSLYIGISAVVLVVVLKLLLLLVVVVVAVVAYALMPLSLRIIRH